MKKLTLIIAIFPLLLSANWMSEEDIAKKNNGEHGVKIHMHKDKCEVGGKICHDISGQELGFKILGDVEVDDPSKPMWEAKSSVTECSGQVDCQEKMIDLCDEGYSVFADESYSEVYCTKIIGYEKMMIKGFIEDSEKKAELEAKKTEKEAKENEKKNCLKAFDSDSLKEGELLEAVKCLLKHKGK